jgi:type II pantothenate kinase
MTTVGIDVGATLCKVAVCRGTTFATEHHPSAALAAVRARVGALAPDRVAATGGGASELGETLGECAVEHVGEFDAWAAGTPRVAADEGIALPARYLLVSLGTGTSILSVDGPRATRVGGTAVGGGTALGLAKLILGIDAFAGLIALAERGDRTRVDLMVGEVYRAMPATVARNLTASNFAKLASTRAEDIAHALMGLVGETVVLVALGLARHAAVETVVLGGSTLEGNAPLRTIVDEIAVFFGLRPVFLSRGAYCGAVGAAAVADDARLRERSTEAE